MFLKFTKRSGLVREDLIVSTELITTIQKGSSLLPNGQMNTVADTFNPTIDITSRIPGQVQNGEPQVQQVNLTNQRVFNSIQKEVAYYIYIFMRDPILNKSQNNRTFNNAIILEFRPSQYEDDDDSDANAKAQDARDQYWDLITGAEGINATPMEVNSLLP